MIVKWHNNQYHHAFFLLPSPSFSISWTKNLHSIWEARMTIDLMYRELSLSLTLYVSNYYVSLFQCHIYISRREEEKI